MIKNKGFKLCTVVLLSLLLGTACSSTPRGLAHKAYRPAAEVALPPQSVEVSEFALEVSTMVVGESRYFAHSPLGSVEVQAMHFYDNALGEQCRKASAAAGGHSGTMLFTVCKLQDGTWYYHQPLTAELH